MSDLSKLRRPEGAHRSRKRLGRGPGSGLGKTAGKGHKGQKARAGGNVHPWFEGGQMPLQRRVSKRGFTNTNRVVYEIVKVRDIAALQEEEITPEVLAAHRLAHPKKGPIKILGDGSIERKVIVRVHAVSASARSKIEAAGGTVELLES